VGGAQFEIRADNGNGFYEPDGADAPVLASLDATYGFAVFNPPGPGSYWVTESSPPAGLTKAPPQLVHYTVPTASLNCAVLHGTETCDPDDDNSGGFLVVVIVNSPTGGVGPETDTAAPVEDAPATGPWLVIVGALAGWAVVFPRLLRRRRE
jgi:hypothetical protein